MTNQELDQLSINTIRSRVVSMLRGERGRVIGMQTFGASAPLKALQ